MLQKSFSEGIHIEKAGPYHSTSCRTTCCVNKERSYRTSVYLEPKLIKKRSYLTVDSEVIDTRSTKATATYNRACSLSNGSVKSYESSVSIDQEDVQQPMNGDQALNGLKCLQNIELIPGFVEKDFSETVNVFWSTIDKSFRSNVVHNAYDVKKNYIVGLEVNKVREVTPLSDEFFTSSMHIPMEPSLELNGDLL